MQINYICAYLFHAIEICFLNKYSKNRKSDSYSEKHITGRLIYEI